MILDELTYEQCVVQGVGPMVFPARLEKGIDSAHSAQMKAVCVHNMQQQVMLQYILEQAWKALEKAGIKAVLMKGAGLAALYPSPERRTWSDIDLFVGIDQYHPACAVMRDTFPDALKFDEELDHYKHYNLIADGVSIEVHRVSMSCQHPIDEKRYARMEREGMSNGERLELNGLEITVPEPTFNALFVFMHSWEHMLTKGANVRQLCDLALLLRHYKDRIDRSRLNRYLKELHLSDVWQLYAYNLVNGLGLEAGDMPFYSEKAAQRAERLMTDLLAGRMEAPKSQEAAPQGRLARKIFTMRERLTNAKRIARYSPSYARHMTAETVLHGAMRLFAKDRKWE